MSIKIPSDINARLIEIWNRAQSIYKDNSKNPPPFLSPIFFSSKFNPKRCRLLIIGLNPSFSETGWQTILNKYKGDPADSQSLKKLRNSVNKNGLMQELNSYFKYSNLGSKQTEILRLENISFEEHDYFSKMHQIGEKLYGIAPPFLHLDLFQYRITNQDDFKKLFRDNFKFFNKQLTLSKEIIKWLNPEIILISNAFSCELFREMYYPQIKLDEDRFIQYKGMENFVKDYFRKEGSKAQKKRIANKESIKPNINQLKILNYIAFQIFHNKYFVSETGTYDIEIIPNQNKVPIFFSGMLSGVRALDLGSFERLKWHIKAIHDKKTMSSKWLFF